MAVSEEWRVEERRKGQARTYGKVSVAEFGFMRSGLKFRIFMVDQKWLYFGKDKGIVYWGINAV